MKRLNQYLQNRNERWHYVRRVPAPYTHLDTRITIRTALRTSSLEVARHRRDALAEADDQYWATLSSANANDNSADHTDRPRIAVSRYKSAKQRAMARGFIYSPAAELADISQLSELLLRLTEVARQPDHNGQEAEALLGGVKPAAPTITEAFKLYTKELSIGDLHGKSIAQRREWFKPKQRAVNNFTAKFGDLPMDQITRKHAREFYNWWAERLKPQKDKKTMNPNTANRDLGNMRKLYRVYWEYEGDESRENPFRKLRFNDSVYKDIPPFENEWIRTKILRPCAFDGLNEEARLIVYCLIETGCRPSEIANILPENIMLDHKVPHIRIRPSTNRQLKSNSAVRDIPLVGISLEAFKRAPNGFAHYKDKSSLLSSSLMKTFRIRGLLPTKDHRVYSFRHSFEKRMLEAGLDYGLRCLLMGHKNSRPSYGDGGSLEYRQTELLKIAHDVPDSLIQTLKPV
ncbi:MAG: integrase [Robiginitomaculum sp.]|nr:MAG: integrase [Robiginitomaculum sp.]